MAIKIASNGKRFIAYLIDIIPIVLMVFIIFYFFFGFDETLNTYLSNKGDANIRAQFLKERNVIRNLSLAVWVLLGMFMDSSRYQGTFGKLVMKIKVSDAEGKPITFGKSVVRNSTKILSIIPLFIGIIWILFDKKHRGWHDKIANTLIITNPGTF